MSGDEIDLVVPWCDDADEKWRAKRLACARRVGRPMGEYVNGACRYRGGDELKYMLRSLDLYAPWFCRVHLLVDDDAALPAWLRTDIPDLCVVRHSDFVPHAYLPTFTPDTFEHFLWAIPGLADRFVFANDDTMFSRPTPRSFFFAPDGMPIFRFGSRRRFHQGDAGASTYHAGMDRSEAMVVAKFGHRAGLACALGRSPHHNMDAYLKRDYKDCYELFRMELAETGAFRFPFRSEEGCQRILYALFALATGRGHFRRAPFNTKWNKPWWRYLIPSRGESLQFSGSVWKHAEKQLYRYRPYLFCFNDGVETTETDRRWLDDFYRRRFPAPSRFERQGGVE